MTIPEYMLAFLLIGNLGCCAANYARTGTDMQNVEQLNLVLAHLGIDPTAQIAPSSGVISLAADPRQRIEAIKAYRMQTGAGLKEAADSGLIDKIAASVQGSGA